MTEITEDGTRLIQSTRRIGNTTYIVKSAIKKDAEKVILKKIEKLIKNDIEKMSK